MALLVAGCPVCQLSKRPTETPLDELKAIISDRHYQLSHQCWSRLDAHYYVFRRWLVLPDLNTTTTIECGLCQVWFPLPNNMILVDCADEA